jgi:NAD(P)H-hydrate epimerase
MDLEILNKSKCKIILTPHLKEFSRLTNYEIPDIMNNLVAYGVEFTSKYHVTLLLKGPTTLIFDNNQVYFCNSGNSGMATAGSGDVLTGIITGLLGYHNENIGLSVAAAAYINGYAGDLAADKYTEISMISSDTVSMIPEVFKMAEKY